MLPIHFDAFYPGQQLIGYCNCVVKLFQEFLYIGYIYDGEESDPNKME